MTHVPLPGSHRRAPEGEWLGSTDSASVAEATLILRRPGAEGVQADYADIEAVCRAASRHGLTVIGTHPLSRAVRVAGSVAQLNAAFGTELADYQLDGRIVRCRAGELRIPAEIDGVVVAVLGLDQRPHARAPHAISPRATSGYSPREVAARYGFPTDHDGSGQTVALIELGGGFETSDLSTYWTQQGVQAPSVTAVAVDGVGNAPSGGQGADVEVALDIEVLGAVAPGANQLVFFAPNTDQGFYDCIATAVHHTAHPSVISISWGGPESEWPPSTLDAFDALCADAAKAGITVFAAAGDNGATDGTSGNTVDFPASSPHVIACGGTTLTASGETVWNELAAGEGATGGGISSHFPAPAYQAALNLHGRGVPDVAGNADPVTGYQVYVGGQPGIVGGTSAVAPLWAALAAIANQANANRPGDIHPQLYKTPGAFTDITQGGNGGYAAAVGWDACCGLGTPLGHRVVAALASPAAPPPPPPPPSAPPPPTTSVLTLLEAYRAELLQQLTTLNEAISSLGGS